MGYSSYGAGLGVGLVIFFIVLYIAILALAVWVSYLITRTAVKNGIILAFQQLGIAPPAPGGFAPGGPITPASPPGTPPQAPGWTPPTTPPAGS